MKIILPVVIVLSFFLPGCSNRPTGTYVCSDQDKSRVEFDSVTKTHHSYMDIACAIREYTFKDNNSVIINMGGTEFVSSYETGREYTRVKLDKTELLLRQVDNQTIVVQGVLPGNYKRIGKEPAIKLAPNVMYYVGGGILLATLIALLYNWDQGKKNKAERERLKREIKHELDKEQTLIV